MRFHTLQITDHAIDRWKQRVDPINFTADTIREAVAKAAIVKKGSPLPYTTPRVPNVVYATHNRILFILQPVNIDEFILITVVTKSNNYLLKFTKKKTKSEPKFVDKNVEKEPTTKKKYRRKPFRETNADN